MELKHDVQAYRGRTPRGGPSNRLRAFTIIELIVVAGITMLLIGLVSPALSGARARADQIRRLANARQCGTIILTYCADHKDVYPVADVLVDRAMTHWFEVVGIGNPAEAAQVTDPDGMRKHGLHRFSLSACMVHPPTMMTPGSTVPMDLARATALRQGDVLYPSDKGLLTQWLHVETDRHVFWTYHAAHGPLGPVLQADGSGNLRRCSDYILDHDFFENWVGHPVLATWEGARGRDRLR